MSNVVPTSIIAAILTLIHPMADFMSYFTRTCRPQQDP